MRFRGSVAIDLGTVNTLVWVAGRGIVLEEPTAIAIDTGVGKVAAVGEAADALADKEPQDIEVIHPLRDGVIADLDATAAMLHAFLRRTRRFSLARRDALVCVPSGATPVERRSIVAALSVRRPRYNVRLIDEPVAAAAGAGFDLTGGAEGFAEAVGLDVAQRTPRTEYVPGGLVAAALEPIVAAIAGTVHEMLSEIPAGLAEDVVRGKVRLAGGGALLPGLASRIETAAGIGTVLVDDPMRCVIRGAAEILERKDQGQQSGPGLRHLTFPVP